MNYLLSQILVDFKSHRRLIRALKLIIFVFGRLQVRMHLVVVILIKAISRCYILIRLAHATECITVTVLVNLIVYTLAEQQLFPIP